MYIYRIYTEDSEQYRKNVQEILDKIFDSYTLLPGIGAWKGKVEKSLVVEIIKTSEHETLWWDAVERAAYQIKDKNNQEAVLVTVHQESTFLVA